MTNTVRTLPRWYLLYASPAWSPTKFDEDGLIEIVSKFFGTLRNVYNFFVLYSNQDDMDPRLLWMYLMQKTGTGSAGSFSKYNKLIHGSYGRYGSVRPHESRKRDHRTSLPKICPTGISEEQEEDSGRKNWTKTRSRYTQRPMKYWWAFHS